MFGGLKNFLGQRQMKKDLLEFLSEMEDNLERFYVMDQRQFVTEGFSLKAWGAVSHLEIIQRHPTILNYVTQVEEFNKSFKEHKEFEAWYASDINHKTQENAKKLHAMKNFLDTRLKTLERIIISAGQDLERELVQFGLLKL